MRNNLIIAIIISLICLSTFVVVVNIFLNNQESISPDQINKTFHIKPLTMSLDEAYSLCNETDCPDEEVTIRGNLSGFVNSNGASFIIPINSDYDKRIIVRYNENVSSINAYIWALENHLINNGTGWAIIEAEVTGFISKEYVCTKNCAYVTKMLVGLEDIRYIKKVGCREDGIVAYNDYSCFDHIDYEISISEAYKLLKNSDGFDSSNFIRIRNYNSPTYSEYSPYYSDEDASWNFELASFSDDCDVLYKVSKKDSIFINSCENNKKKYKWFYDIRDKIVSYI